MTHPDPRLHPPDPETYAPRQRAVHDAIASGRRGAVYGPLALWLHRPELAAHAQALGRYCRYDSALPRRLSELAILVTASVFDAEFEWQAHAGDALDAGLDPAIVEAIRTGRTPVFGADETGHVVYDVALSAHQRRGLGDALYARAEALLGPEQLVDLVGLLGYYTLISLTLNIFRVPADAPPALDGG